MRKKLALKIDSPQYLKDFIKNKDYFTLLIRMVLFSTPLDEQTLEKVITLFLIKLRMSQGKPFQFFKRKSDEADALFLIKQSKYTDIFYSNVPYYKLEPMFLISNRLLFSSNFRDIRGEFELRDPTKSLVKKIQAIETIGWYYFFLLTTEGKIVLATPPEKPPTGSPKWDKSPLLYLDPIPIAKNIEKKIIKMLCTDAALFMLTEDKKIFYLPLLDQKLVNPNLKAIEIKIVGEVDAKISNIEICDKLSLAIYTESGRAIFLSNHEKLTKELTCKTLLVPSSPISEELIVPGPVTLYSGQLGFKSCITSDNKFYEWNRYLPKFSEAALPLLDKECVIALAFEQKFHLILTNRGRILALEAPSYGWDSDEKKIRTPKLLRADNIKSPIIRMGQHNLKLSFLTIDHELFVKEGGFYELPVQKNKLPELRFTATFKGSVLNLRKKINPSLDNQKSEPCGIL